MKVIKSIFDKSYIVEAQAIKAIAKEFGVDAKYYEARQIEGSKKWQVCDIYKPDPIIEVATVASDEPSRLTRDEATKKFRFMHIERPLVEWDESAEAAQARVEALKNGLAAIHPELALAEMAMPADVLAEHGAFQALVADAAAAIEEFDEDELERFADEQRAAARKANASMGLQDAKPRLSSCVRPTKKVWDIADCMAKASRKEVMDECVRQGVAYGTARTQYQAWFKASQEALRGDIRQPYEKGEK